TQPEHKAGANSNSITRASVRWNLAMGSKTSHLADQTIAALEPLGWKAKFYDPQVHHQARLLLLDKIVNLDKLGANNNNNTNNDGGDKHSKREEEKDGPASISEENIATPRFDLTVRWK